MFQSIFHLWWKDIQLHTRMCNAIISAYLPFLSVKKLFLIRITKQTMLWGMPSFRTKSCPIRKCLQTSDGLAATDTQVTAIPERHSKCSKITASPAPSAKKSLLIASSWQKCSAGSAGTQTNSRHCPSNWPISRLTVMVQPWCRTNHGHHTKGTARYSLPFVLK